MAFAIRLATLCLLLAATLAAQPAFHLKDGDTVVFYGDSITDQRLYTTFAETFAVTRFPRANVKFVHSGWGGDRVTGGGGGAIEVRLKRDVFAYKPTVMTIMLGMNDGRYRAYDQEIFSTYSEGFKSIVKSVRAAAPGVRITVIQPSPYDDVTRAPLFEGGYNALLVRYGGFLKELANAEKLNLADLNTPVVAELEKANRTDFEAAKRIIPDRVHPGPAGHLLMAKALLKAWNAPAIVTEVQIDAAKGTVTRSTNTTVSDLKKGDEITWTQVDQALPMPVDMKDATMALAVRSSDFETSLNQQPLRVTGLSNPHYRFTIDGDYLGTYTNQQLADGVNLAMQSTPMARQAAEVHALTIKHNNVHFARWRQVQVPLEPDQLPAATAAITAMDRLEEEIVQRQRSAAQPKPRQYRLVPE